MSDEYLIWSNEHRSWWRGGRTGYTRQLKSAGVYSREEAIKTCRNAIAGTAHRLGMLPEVPVRLADFDDIVRDMKLPEILKR
jgi:hypothetical protein